MYCNSYFVDMIIRGESTHGYLSIIPQSVGRIKHYESLCKGLNHHNWLTFIGFAFALPFTEVRRTALLAMRFH